MVSIATSLSSSKNQLSTLKRSCGLLLSVTILSCLALTMLSPAYILAEDYSIRTVDMAKLMKATKVASEKLPALEAKSKKQEQDFKAQRDSIKSFEKKLIDKNVTPDSKEADELRVKARDFDRKLKDSQEEMQKQYAQISKEALKQAQEAINSYAQKNKVSLVLEKGAKGASPVLYGEAGSDITAELISSMK